MFRTLKLYFTNRPYYEQWKRYKKLQKTMRKKLVQQAKEFCPWSGAYLHDMVKTMLEFYYETYKAGDCCWCVEESTQKKAAQLAKTLEYVEELQAIDEMECSDLLDLAHKEPSFEKWVEKWEKKNDCTATSDMMLYGLAYEYFEQKYTKAIYKTIGEHIWEWCD
jgi:hypothetical protein